MNRNEAEMLLMDIKSGKISIEEGAQKVLELSEDDIGFAKIDNTRELRTGYPEVIYCAGKTTEQIKAIVNVMLTKDNNILLTRANEYIYKEIKEISSIAKFNELGRTISIIKKNIIKTDSYIAVVTAGTSDIPIAEEAVSTAEIFGNKVERIYDVGVAGIHRLFNRLDVIRSAKVVIVVAGMEGALASVVGGLVDKPVIAVPTSIGYGSNFGGLSALLSMLNSCANGVSVVNIDNGYGAGYIGSTINKL